MSKYVVYGILLSLMTPVIWGSETDTVPVIRASLNRFFNARDFEELVALHSKRMQSEFPSKGPQRELMGRLLMERRKEYYKVEIGGIAVNQMQGSAVVWIALSYRYSDPNGEATRFMIVSMIWEGGTWRVDSTPTEYTEAAYIGAFENMIAKEYGGR